MESRFPQRVTLERKALDVLNECKIFNQPLAGFSSVTIERWLASVVLPNYATAESMKLRTTLFSIAYAARSEADVSDEIYVDINESEAYEAMEELKNVLKLFGASVDV